MPIDDEEVHLKRYYGKYYFWINQIPPTHKIPLYCNGQCYLISAENVRRIFHEALVTHRGNFRVEGKQKVQC